MDRLVLALLCIGFIVAVLIVAATLVEHRKDMDDLADREDRLAQSLAQHAEALDVLVSGKEPASTGRHARRAS